MKHDPATQRRGGVATYFRLPAFPTLRVLFALALLILATAAQASSVLPTPGFTPGSGVSMRISNFYEDIPPFGYLPLRFEVKNLSNAPHTWKIHTSHSQSTSMSVSYSTEIRAEAMAEQTFDILIPLAAQVNSSRYSSVQIQISGYGVAEGMSSIHASGRGGNLTPYFGMGEELSVKNWGPLDDLVKKRGSRTLDGTPLDTDFLPSDWRGLAGFQIILLTPAEWRKMAPGPRGALMDWIAQGGRLILAHSEQSPPADLPAGGVYGTGNISYVPADDNLVPYLDRLLDGGPDSSGEIVQRSYTWTWPPAREIGRPEPPQIAILLFVIGFAVIIGPVNFFVFAPAGIRHRLFWTTPVISITASVLMALFIFFSEGMGGTGQRFDVMLSLGKENKTVIWQEQVARTGVLLANSFSLSEPEALLLPVRLSDDDSHRPWQDRGKSYFLDGTRWGGDWFRSRRTQAQALVAVVPSRGRLEFTAGPDGVPTVVSTFEHELAEVWYFDPSGHPWSGKNLRPGEKLILTKAESKNFDRWIKEVLTPAGTIIRMRVEEFAKTERAGKFLASATAPNRIGSLPSIRWHDTYGVVFGRTTP